MLIFLLGAFSPQGFAIVGAVPTGMEASPPEVKPAPTKQDKLINAAVLVGTIGLIIIGFNSSLVLGAIAGALGITASTIARIRAKRRSGGVQTRIIAIILAVISTILFTFSIAALVVD